MTSRAGTILHEARLRAGLTQTELGERAGVAQSVVSAYESGRREPSFDTLAALVHATGFELSVDLTPSFSSTPLQRRVFAHRKELRRAIATHGGSRPRLFGSVARGEDTAGSDVDLLVDVASDVGLIELALMRSAAEKILGTSVDVVPSIGLKPEVRDSVMRDAVRL